MCEVSPGRYEVHTGVVFKVLRGLILPCLCSLSVVLCSLTCSHMRTYTRTHHLLPICPFLHTDSRYTIKFNGLKDYTQQQQRLRPSFDAVPASTPVPALASTEDPASASTSAPEPKICQILERVPSHVRESQYAKQESAKRRARESQARGGVVKKRRSLYDQAVLEAELQEQQEQLGDHGSMVIRHQFGKVGLEELLMLQTRVPPREEL